jgi:hypothetical protein
VSSTPKTGLEVRHFGRTRFLPNWQPAPIKAPAFLPWARGGSRFAGASPLKEAGFEPVWGFSCQVVVFVFAD